MKASCTCTWIHTIYTPYLYMNLHMYLYLYLYLYLTLYHDMYPYTLDLKDTFYLYHYLYLCVWWSYKFTICLLNLAKGFPHLIKKNGVQQKVGKKNGLDNLWCREDGQLGQYMYKYILSGGFPLAYWYSYIHMYLVHAWAAICTRDITASHLTFHTFTRLKRPVASTLTKTI